MTSEAEKKDNGCCQKFKNEFKVSNFLLGHEYPGMFHRAKFANGPSVLFLIWRVFWALYHIAMIGVSAHFSQFYASSQENRKVWPIFLTNLALCILTVSTIMDMSISIHFYINKKEILRGGKSSNPWYVKMFWVVMNIANALGFVVGITYWGFLYKNNGFDGYRILPLLTHGMNMVYITLNLLVTAMPVRLLHFYHVATVYIIYMIFSVIYTFAGGINDEGQPYIYPILNWKQSPGMAAGFAVVGAVGSCFAHVISYLIHLLRDLVCRCSSADVRVSNP